MCTRRPSATPMTWRGASLSIPQSIVDDATDQWTIQLRACGKAICYNWPVLFRATHILQEKTHACGVLKRRNFRVHVSPGSAETLVRRGGIINHHSITYSLSNISVKNYRNRLRWVESIVCNISVVFLRHSVHHSSLWLYLFMLEHCIYIHSLPKPVFTVL